MSPKRKPALPLAGYTRVSSQGDRADEELMSHDLQRAKIEAGATAFGYEVLPERFEDTNASGGSMDRPAFNRVMEGIRDGRYGGIVVAKLSRFARTTQGGLKAIFEIEEAGGAFVCLDPPIDTASSSGRFILTVFLGLYAMERENTQEIAWSVKDAKIADGVHQSASAPAGYDFSVVGYKLDKKTGAQLPVRGPLVPNADAPAVTEAFRLRAGGASLQDVARHLAAAGVPSRTGSWSINGVRRMLGNKVYRGVAISGAREKEGAHKELVSRTVFAEVQARFGSRAVTWDGKEGPMLGGLIKCASCGGSMSQQWTWTQKNPERRYGFYRCISNLHCEARASVSALQVEPYVLDIALGSLGPIVAYEKRAVVLGAGAEGGHELEEWEAALDALRAEQEELDAAQAGGEISATAYARATTGLEARRSELEGRRPRAGRGPLVEMLASAETLRGAFDAASVPRRREALGALVERVVVSKGRGDVEHRVKVELKPLDLKALGLVAIDRGPGDPEEPFSLEAA